MDPTGHRHTRADDDQHRPQDRHREYRSTISKPRAAGGQDDDRSDQQNRAGHPHGEFEPKINPVVH